MEYRILQKLAKVRSHLNRPTPGSLLSIVDAIISISSSLSRLQMKCPSSPFRELGHASQDPKRLSAAFQPQGPAYHVTCQRRRSLVKKPADSAKCGLADPLLATTKQLARAPRFHFSLQQRTDLLQTKSSHERILLGFLCDIRHLVCGSLRP